ncbi:MAG: hypothetical protein GF331_15915, partial [Chitinivibrionales bacterium]|nr:hypothetical protein [Chitinivibrionales bacterium]
MQKPERPGTRAVLRVPRPYAVVVAALLLSPLTGRYPHAAPSAKDASDDLELRSTEVTLPWRAFRDLLNRRVDTVRVGPENRPPAAAVPERATVTITLDDSTVGCALSYTYTVLSSDEWARVPFAPSGSDLRLTSLHTHRGDHLAAREDGGFELFVQGVKSGRTTRALDCAWSLPAPLEHGMRTADVFVPAVPAGTVEILVPPGFSSLAVEPGVLLNRSVARGGQRWVYSLPPGRRSVRLRYVPPAAVAQPDSTTDTVDTPAGREPRITADHEAIVFVSADRTVFLNAIHVAVAHAPVRELVLRVPSSLHLLSLSGSGTGRWRATGDSLLTVPQITVDGAKRQIGRFAVAAGGAAEARFVMLDDCMQQPRQIFASRLSPSLAQLAGTLGLDTRDVLIAGSWYDTTFTARVAVEHHRPVYVADAVIDSVHYLTALSTDRKAVTHVLYRVRQRNRQFVTLDLPDSAHLWFMKIQGREATPFRDDSGRVKAPLQRYAEAGDEAALVNVELVYFEDLATEGGGPLGLVAASPD